MNRLLAIGDIHGCSRAFDALLEAVSPTTDDVIVTLGDYVDRGPDSSGVIDRLLALRASHRLVALRGNHEIMLLDSQNGGSWLQTWRSCGGRETMLSYGMDPEELAVPDELPPTHQQFLEEALVPYHETETHIFVHACLAPETPVDQQTEADLYWRKYINPLPHESGKTWVCGHSAQRSGRPVASNGSICIDSYVYGDEGWLTCMEVNEGRFWQANEAGDCREFSIADVERR